MKKKVKDLKIADVLILPEFKENIKAVYKEWQHVRRQSKRRSHPFDRLTCDPYRLTLMYAEVRNGKSECGSTTRQMVDAIGTEAFKRTMKILLDNEKKANNNNGKD